MAWPCIWAAAHQDNQHLSAQGQQHHLSHRCPMLPRPCQPHQWPLQHQPRLHMTITMACTVSNHHHTVARNHLSRYPSLTLSTFCQALQISLLSLPSLPGIAAALAIPSSPLSSPTITCPYVCRTAPWIASPPTCNHQVHGKHYREVRRYVFRIENPDNRGQTSVSIATLRLISSGSWNICHHVTVSKIGT